MGTPASCIWSTRTLIGVNLNQRGLPETIAKHQESGYPRSCLFGTAKLNLRFDRGVWLKWLHTAEVPASRNIGRF